MKKVLFWGLLFGILLTVGCSSPTGGDATYYYETGGVSNTAYNLIKSNAGISAQQALAYCNQYPLANDIYKDAESGYTRSELENDLNQINVPGFSKAQFLRMLDTSGAVFQMFTTKDDDIIYLYVESE